VRATWRTGFEIVLVLSACSTSSTTTGTIDDAGAEAAPPDLNACTHVSNAAGDRYGRALFNEDKTCATIDDCVLHGRAPSCVSTCGGTTPMSKTGARALDALVDDINAHECADFRDAGCPPAPRGCPPLQPPSELACVDGGCTTTPL